LASGDTSARFTSSKLLAKGQADTFSFSLIDFLLAISEVNNHFEDKTSWH